MNETKDIRWKQRFANYTKALGTLRQAVALSGQRELSALEQQGLIQSFEFTRELAWKVMKDFLEFQGYPNIIGSRDAIREAFKNGLLNDGQVWIDMIDARNESSHTYDLARAEKIVASILTSFFPAFVELEDRFYILENRLHE